MWKKNYDDFVKSELYLHLNNPVHTCLKKYQINKADEQLIRINHQYVQT